MANSFQTDLAFSLTTTGMFDAAYYKLFPNLLAITRLSGDSPAQRSGMDVLVTLSNGRTLSIDEKASRKARSTLFLEVTAHGKPGWLCKPLACDYIAYGFVPTNEVFLLPWPHLKAIYEANRKQWHEKYMKSTATSTGVCVPISEVYEELSKSLRVAA